MAQYGNGASKYTKRPAESLGRHSNNQTQQGENGICMLLRKEGECYVLECSAREHHRARIGGFAWHTVVPYQWATRSPGAASDFIEFADEELAQELLPHKAGKQKSLEMSSSNSSTFKPSVPQGLSLLPFQLAGVEFLLGRDRALLADEMGLGKTIQAAVLINEVKPESALIVCPASLKLNWEFELSRWLTVKRIVKLVNSGSDILPENRSGHIFIINYDLIKRHKDWLLGHEWDIIIGDESHAIKNSRASRTRVFTKLKSKRTVLITGTPILNRPVELWTTLKMLDPERWHSWYHFVDRYCDAKQSRFGIDTSGAKNLDELNGILRSSIMIRRMKKDVLTELPPKFRQVIEMPCADTRLIDRENRAYNQYMEIVAALEAIRVRARKTGNDLEFAEEVKKLREARAIRFSELSKARHDVALYKMPRVVEHVRSIDRKVVCFAHHRDVLQEIAKQTGGIIFMGGMSTEAKRSAEERFASSDQHFIASIRAAGVGINLTSSNHVVFAEMDWTPAILSQAEDRCHRKGQVENVLVQHLVLEGSLDARMAKLCVSKQQNITKAID